MGDRIDVQWGFRIENACGSTMGTMDHTSYSKICKMTAKIKNKLWVGVARRKVERHIRFMITLSRCAFEKRETLVKFRCHSKWGKI